MIYVTILRLLSRVQADKYGENVVIALIYATTTVLGMAVPSLEDQCTIKELSIFGMTDLFQSCLVLFYQMEHWRKNIHFVINKTFIKLQLYQMFTTYSFLLVLYDHLNLNDMVQFSDGFGECKPQLFMLRMKFLFKCPQAAFVFLKVDTSFSSTSDFSADIKSFVVILFHFSYLTSRSPVIDQDVGRVLVLP